MKKHILAKAIAGISMCLGLSVLSCSVTIGSAYAADTSDIDTSSTKAEVQEVVDEGNFDYTELSTDVISHIYSLYDGDPETIRALQRQSDGNSSSTAHASLAAATKYTHSSMFDGYTVLDGIDVSEWNGSINWPKVKADGIDFVFIRAGWRGYTSGAYNVDENFKTNITGALAAGLDVGVYFFTAAINQTEAKEEANYVMKLVSGYNINLPIVMDYEYGVKSESRLYKANLSKSAATSVVKKFCSTVESKGYTGMIYASKSVLESDMNGASIAKSYPVWSAQYNDTDTLTSTHSYWQYTSGGTVKGINARTDLNYRYITTPPAPTLAQSSSTDTSITMTWSKIPGVYGYQIYKYDATDGQYKYLATIRGAGKVSYTESNLPDGQEYKYIVRGVYSLNSGSVYGNFSAEAAGSTIPDNVENFKAASKKKQSITFTWTAMPVATGYILYKYNSTTKKYEELVNLTSSAISSYTDATVSPGKVYQYKIRAYSVSETGTVLHSLSDPLLVTTPTGIDITSNSSDSMKITWEKKSNAAGYILYTWNYSTHTWKKLAKLSGASNNSYTRKGLKSATKYKYSIITYYKNGKSIKYGKRSDAAIGYTGLSSSKRMIFTPKSSDSVKLTWRKVSKATGYLVYVYDEDKKSYKKIGDVVGGSKTSYTVKGLESGTSYTFAIKAYKSGIGYIAYGSRKTVSAFTLPGTVSKFKSQDIGSYTCLKWNKSSAASGYIIYKYNKSTGTYKKIKKLVGASSNSYAGSILSDDYEYRVQIYVTYNKKTYYGSKSGSAAEMTGTLYGKVNDTEVYVRKGAGTKYGIKATLKKGKTVQILNVTESGGTIWYRITYTSGGKKVKGYMSAKYITLK